MPNNYYKISVFIKKEEEIYYAYCSGLAGCHSQGSSYEEAKKNIQEAMDLYLETFTEPEAMAYFGKKAAQQAGNPGFDIELKLTSPQAEKLLVNSGFSVAGSKDNHRLYLKSDIRIVLPLHPEQVLSQQITKEILEVVKK